MPMYGSEAPWRFPPDERQQSNCSTMKSSHLSVLARTFARPIARPPCPFFMGSFLALSYLLRTISRKYISRKGRFFFLVFVFFGVAAFRVIDCYSSLWYKASRVSEVYPSPFGFTRKKRQRQLFSIKRYKYTQSVDEFTNL